MSGGFHILFSASTMLSGVVFFSAGPGGAVKPRDCGGLYSISTLHPTKYVECFVDA
jgi:hypothetical protein